MSLRFLSVWQPNASLLSLGLQEYAISRKRFTYCGRLAIHAASRMMTQQDWEVVDRVQNLSGGKINPLKHFQDYGAIIAVADLVGCYQIRDCGLAIPQFIAPSSVSKLERAVGQWCEGFYALKIANPTLLPEPIPFKGKQGIRAIDDASVLASIAAQLGGVAA